VRERAEALINVAHPDHRDWLREATAASAVLKALHWQAETGEARLTDESGVASGGAARAADEDTMADSTSFEFACAELERTTSLDRLEARGTVRLALKETGLEAHSVTPGQMATVMMKVLPKELATRGIKEGESTCTAIAAALSDLPDEDVADTPEAVFQRLGGRT
jgi:hypothetical protein